ncbi:(Fe-S)-binding protein [Salisediminibacterium halotolerans]|uniref:Glycolate oxidase iron-sulfur subunit n=1 Tax=Salisediminibacterium halotolerans TaxID=517425 RepID=A0A1H9S371_9BACI|nr:MULTISPECIES: (Fe-S)-binding protein [Salisediminibacterium]RLJ78193.1 glycolate oxidase iron-sulfur subunit [Actinophytocola xinjiangensis]RPE88468.1 glycolate oxidase iron-sulfur subunit [Salisediminibacterium halotolerans]TWG37170.1 glycolate oxidase iron-sulfur subunit [Salisediminibacterium halotolerans]SER79441.1 glycolate oxidase iron-sulfur subunit [Salisediminibacterium haloalkalitolerans]GEL08997.1 glycolate oxidase iron-sulfur subunit [Salisediminibacterium halotolerans]
MTANKEQYRAEVTKQFQEKMDYDELLNCMRCGFCLPHCPTYIETDGNEAASPRGRIALMKAVVDGKMEPDEDFEAQLSLCLGCRACEPVCPSGVKYGHLLEEAVDILQQNKEHSMPVKMFRSFLFDHVFPKPERMRQLNGLMWFYQKSGIQKAARTMNLTKIAGGHMAQMERVLPEIPSPRRMKQRPRRVEAEGERKKTVAFFSGCLMDTMFMDTNDETLYLLKKAGCDVVIPEKQNCCGAIHAHSGEKEQAKELAKQNIAAFEEGDYDYIISNAGGCGAVLDEYDHLLKDDPDWSERAKAFAGRVMDISEILYDAGLPPMELDAQIVTFQDSCHLRNVMGTASAPRKLLHQIEGVTFVETAEADRCCGSAGTYNLIEEEMSMQILDHKMENIDRTAATTVVTANPGCLLQMKLGVEREDKTSTMEAVHIVDLLAKAVRYKEEKTGSPV